MKTCFHCGYLRKRGDPEGNCPRCRRDPNRPSLKMRLREGWLAFVDAGLPKGYHERVFKPKQATIMDYLNNEVTTVDLTDPRE